MPFHFMKFDNMYLRGISFTNAMFHSLSSHVIIKAGVPFDLNLVSTQNSEAVKKV